MKNRAFLISISFLMTMGLACEAVWAQMPAGARVGNRFPMGELRKVEKLDWHIFGRVTDLKGEPVGDARVRVQVVGGVDSVQNLQTNLRGEFRTDYNLDAQSFKQLSVKVVASKTGYREAKETVDFGASDKTWGIDVVLREEAEDPDQISQAALIGSLAPRLRRLAAEDPAIGPARRDFQRGAEEFLDRHNPVQAVPLLAKVVERRPECAECRVLLGLALLDAGSWAGAMRQLAEAAKLGTAQQGAMKADTLLVLGVLEAWRREDKKAAGFFMQALDLDPQNPHVLQELGRVLIFQKNWEAADQYLEKAIKAGASEDARLLRVRALLEEGDIEAANDEMTTYLAGRDIKDFPLAARTLYTELQTHLNLRSYDKAKSLVGEPLPQLMKTLPELDGLEPAPVQEALADILRNTGEAVESFFRSFPNTVSREQIRQERLGKEGKVKDSLEQRFQYLLLTRPEKWGLGLEEYRTDSRGSLTGPGGVHGGFMLTSGFASASLLFHPAYQSGASFRYLGRQKVEGRECLVVAFAQRPETARMVERFNTDEASVLVLLQGVAWIDASNYRIVRLRTDLLKPPSKLRLQRQRTDIRYEPVQFREIETAMWLPREVGVTVEWKGRTFHNLHRYSDFKLFNVETKEKKKPMESAPKVPEKPE